MKYNILTIVSAISLICLQSCFTGIESTPRITYSDVKREHIQQRPEEKLLADVVQEGPAKWQIGKRFFVTDSKISLILTPDSQVDVENLVGKEIRYTGTTEATSLTGERIAVVGWTDTSGHNLYYRTDTPYDEFMAKDHVDIPFVIDIEIVEKAKERMVGHEYYITTPLWYDKTGINSVSGLRHVPVEITDVRPGNTNFPLLVVFEPEHSGKLFSVLMSTGNKYTSTRNFETLFSFDNPRNKYPHIDDDTWQLIIHSLVKSGMTRDECRLALGAPKTIGQRPTTAGMVEYWSYSDGVYLLFEDGFLSSFRH